MSEGRVKFCLRHAELGVGQPVVLIHGMAASRYDWEALVPSLAAVGCRALAVDLLGHGDSAKPADPDAYTVENLYRSLLEWIDSLSLTQPLILVGHSLGGYLSLRYAFERPEQVKALALIAPLYRLDQISPLLRALRNHTDLGARLMESVPLTWIDRLLAWDAINRAGFSLRARRQIAIDYKRASPEILRIVRHLPDLTLCLECIRAPTLVVWGERDLTLNPASFPPLVARLPNAQGRPLERCGHQPHIGQPMRVNRMLLDFLGLSASRDSARALPVLSSGAAPFFDFQ